MGCPRGTYRGVTICEHSRPKFERLAAGIGSDIYFHPIQGSYSNRVAASAGTHSRGGALDQELDPYSWSQARRCETYARNSCDLLYWVRWWAGNHHGHMLDPACPSLAASAAAQFRLWDRGYDGLVGNNRDTGSRSNLGGIMGQFANRLKTTIEDIAGTIIGQTTYMVRAGDTLGSIATAAGTDLATLLRINNLANPNIIRVGQLITLPGARTIQPKDWFDMADKKDLEQVINERVPAIVRTELTRTATLREFARFLLTGWPFDHDGVPSTPDAVLAVALKELRIAAGASRIVLTDALRRELAVLRGLASADIEAIIARVLADLPAPAPTTPTGPAITTARGVDASPHQSVATVREWAADPACDFVILKASEGMGWKNDLFDQQRDAAGEKYIGAYHFAWPNQDPTKEFRNFVSVANPLPGQIVVLDLEDWGVTDPKASGYAKDKTMRDTTPWTQRIDFAFAWFELAHDELGATVIPYQNWGWVKPFREHTTVEQWTELTSRHPLWLADYDFDMGIHPPVDPKPGTTAGWPVILHQWTSNNNTKDENWTPDFARLRSLGVA